MFSDFIKLIQSWCAPHPEAPAYAPAPTESRKMSIVSDAFSGKISWLTAASEIGGWFQQIGAKSPAIAQMLTADVSTAKQFASDAIGDADGLLAANQANIAKATEVAIETELGVLTGGASHTLDAFTSDGIDKLVAAAVAAAHTTGLAWKAKLAANNPIPAAAQ